MPICGRGIKRIGKMRDIPGNNKADDIWNPKNMKNYLPQENLDEDDNYIEEDEKDEDKEREH